MATSLVPRILPAVAETQSGSLADRLRCKERFEDSLDSFRRHSAAGVND